MDSSDEAPRGRRRREPVATFASRSAALHRSSGTTAPFEGPRLGHVTFRRRSRLGSARAHPPRPSRLASGPAGSSVAVSPPPRVACPPLGEVCLEFPLPRAPGSAPSPAWPPPRRRRGGLMRETAGLGILLGLRDAARRRVSPRLDACPRRPLRESLGVVPALFVAVSLPSIVASGAQQRARPRAPPPVDASSSRSSPRPAARRVSARAEELLVDGDLFLPSGASVSSGGCR